MAVCRNKWLIAFTVMLPTLIEIIDTSSSTWRSTTSAAPSPRASTRPPGSSRLPRRERHRHPDGGLARRLFGRKNYQIASIVLFTFSSFMCGSAWSLTSLVFFRVLQGIGGGGLVPISQSILLETFPPKKHGLAMAIFGVGAMFGPIVGPLMGGWITDTLSWRWIFYINIPIGILAVVMNALVIQDPPYMTAPEDEDRLPGRSSSPSAWARCSSSWTRASRRTGSTRT